MMQRESGGDTPEHHDQDPRASERSGHPIALRTKDKSATPALIDLERRARFAVAWHTEELADEVL